ncbi:hypothetical protein ABZ816_03520 [Actinosynnema sp. NPDC047251]|uniref:ASCH domain-containing protein n=1 Tax=Saccharothrix espanaensis (strain ATCC 51144 / DSM 44229 / JCM 9112 / NBRC 15066 / NRRL 15764) TaxID=1179773 RepID=K0K179_SACES|nr:hypothetical protein [Saccharothrix espanaensis]CCH31327.1 hypothetical protein BN6_40410 [Saccharothrix espanaensis DSM 44229]
MLFSAVVLDGIVAGRIDLAFRRWRRPDVRAGSRITTAAGVVGIGEVAVVEPADVPDADVARAGFADRASFERSLRAGEDRRLYRVEVRHVGEDPRVALRDADDLADDELAAVVAGLRGLDARSGRGAWTADVLALIADRPGVRAADLAEQVGREVPKFKSDVRTLKSRGLTESLETGYRLSARGRRVLDHLRRADQPG